MDDSLRWDILVAAGGTDLHDVMKEAGIETRKRDAKNAIPYQPYVAAV